MTRQEQNQIIAASLQEQLQDKPRVKERIADIYSSWVRGLIQQGMQLLAPQQIQEQQPSIEGQQPPADQAGLDAQQPAEGAA